MPQKLQIPLCSDVYRKTWMEYRHAALKIQYIVSKAVIMYCGSIKTTTASLVFQRLAVVLKWWRRRESNPCPEGH